jgi:hypothetical protein
MLNRVFKVFQSVLISFVLVSALSKNGWANLDNLKMSNDAVLCKRGLQLSKYSTRFCFNSRKRNEWAGNEDSQRKQNLAYTLFTVHVISAQFNSTDTACPKNLQVDQKH